MSKDAMHDEFDTWEDAFKEVYTAMYRNLRNWIWLKSRQYGSHAKFVTMQNYIDIRTSTKLLNIFIEDNVHAFFIFATQRSADRRDPPVQGSSVGG